jgi:hypothetical protein
MHDALCYYLCNQNNLFHKKCIYTWGATQLFSGENSVSCPLCRAQVIGEVQITTFDIMYQIANMHGEQNQPIQDIAAEVQNLANFYENVRFRHETPENRSSWSTLFYFVCIIYVFGYIISPEEDLNHPIYMLARAIHHDILEPAYNEYMRLIAEIEQIRNR